MPTRKGNIYKRERKVAMKLNVIFAPVIAVLLLSACAPKSEDIKGNDKEKSQAPAQDQTNHNRNNEHTGESNNESKNPDQTLSQAEVMDAIKTQLKTNISKVLPNKLPLSEGKHLTATTKSDANHYEIVFYESVQPIPINHNTLGKDQSAKAIMRLQVKKYNSLKEANEQIGFQDYSKSGASTVELGHGVKGYQDAGAGSQWTSWNEGRWALVSRAKTTEGDKGRKLAENAVNYLESHTLPIPKPHGMVHIDVDQSDNRIMWQKETITYTIDQVKDPMVALEIATSFQ